MILHVLDVRFSIVGGVMAGGFVLIWLVTLVKACKSSDKCRKRKRTAQVAPFSPSSIQEMREDV